MRAIPVFLAFLVACGGSPLPSSVTPPGYADSGIPVTPGDVGHLAQHLSGSRIKQRVVTSSDGAKGFVSWYDTTLAVDCYFGTAADGATRCLPSGASVYPANVFADATCTTPGALFPPGVCFSGIRYIYAYPTSGTACGAGGASYYQAGNASDAGVYYTGTPGNCQAGQGQGYVVLSAGASVSPATFEAGAFSVE